MGYGLDWQMLYYIIAGVVAVLLLALLIYIGILNRRVSRLNKKYEFFMQDETGKSMDFIYNERKREKG